MRGAIARYFEQCLGAQTGAVGGSVLANAGNTAVPVHLYGFLPGEIFYFQEMMVLLLGLWDCLFVCLL